MNKLIAVLGAFILIITPIMSEDLTQYQMRNESGYISELNGVYTGTDGHEANIWLDMDYGLLDGQQWQILVTDHKDYGFICYGIFPMDRKQEMIDSPTARHYWNGAGACTTVDAYVLHGSFYYPPRDDIQGEVPLFGQNVGHVWTFTYNDNQLQIDNLVSQGSRIYTLPLDPSRRYFPFSTVSQSQSHKYRPVEDDNNNGGDDDDDECMQWGNECLTVQEIQECHNHLGLLSNNADSVDNVCEDDSNGEITFYNFTLNYNDPFYLHDCLNHRLYFQGAELFEGQNQFDQWQFDSNTQTMTFSIKHLDLEPYGCILAVSDEEYEWQCEMRLDIEFAGVVQYEYAFFMKVYLSRTYTDSLTVSVQKNNVTGDCCENELQIQTQLKWCETFACNAYLSNPLTVQRKQDMYVEHSIASPEFQYYFLHGLSIKLGPFVPEVLNTDGSQPGRYIYHFKSNVAMGNMELVVISRIDENPSRRSLRNLQTVDAEVGKDGVPVEDVEQGMRDDYKVKASEYVTIYDSESDGKDSAEQEEESEDLNVGVIVAITVVGCIVLMGSIGGGVYFLKKRTLKSGDASVKYEEKNTNQSVENSERKLSIISGNSA